MYRAGDVLGACKKELTRTGGAVQTAMREAAASRLKAKGLGRTRATTTKGLDPPAEDHWEEEEGAEDDVPVQRKAKQSKTAPLVADDLRGFGYKRLMAAPTPEIGRLTTLHRLRKGAPKDEAVRSLCEKFGKPTPLHKRLADDTSFWELASDVDTHSTDSRRTKSSSRSRSDSPAMMHAPQQQHQPYADHDLVKQVKALQQQVSQTLGQQQRMVQLEKEKEDMARLLQQERDIVRQQQLKERTSASCLQGNMAALNPPILVTWPHRPGTVPRPATLAHPTTITPTAPSRQALAHHPMLCPTTLPHVSTTTTTTALPALASRP